MRWGKTPPAARGDGPAPSFQLFRRGRVCDYARIQSDSDGPVSRMTGIRPADELAAQVLRQGRPLRIKARGVSMLPFLRDGDVALVMPAAETAIGVGDVICYETPPGGLVLHRVIEHARDRFVTKGDALRFTEVVDPGYVLGKVVAVQRRGRVKRLDTRIARWSNRAIAAVSPLIPFLVAVAVRVRRVARAAPAWVS